MKKIAKFKDYISQEWLNSTTIYKKSENDFLAIIKFNKALKKLVNDQKDKFVKLNRDEAKGTVKYFGTKQEYENEFGKVEK